MFISTIFFASLGIFMPFASGLTLTLRPRDANTLLGEPFTQGDLDPLRQAPCQDLIDSLNNLGNNLCDNVVGSQTQSCYSCLAQRTFFSTDLQTKANTFVSNCAAAGFVLVPIEITPTPTDGGNDDAPSSSRGNDSSSPSAQPSPTGKNVNSDSAPSPTTASSTEKPNGGERLFAGTERIVLGVAAFGTAFLAGL
ncbi:hypothetical protein B0H14DRAFT_3867958 [Mycena olivaceomarginata]|nr:hypothetical protein B0H14DRAFT_3867958 [Mycena olivaceomarginata]